MCQINEWWPEPTLPDDKVPTFSYRKAWVRRIVMIRLPNGDWQVRLENEAGELVGWIVHRCPGPECCRDLRHTKRQFVVYVLPSIIPYASVKVSQHRCF
jgi:hypothetical protein